MSQLVKCDQCGRIESDSRGIGITPEGWTRTFTSNGSLDFCSAKCTATFYGVRGAQRDAATQETPATVS